MEPAADGMDAAPLISVIIPTFQRPDLVSGAVRSVLDQTFRGLEVIVVVDGRDSATTSALSAIHDSRLRIAVPDRHLGNADARNHGVSLARATLVAFLDDDDAWLPLKLERQLEVLHKLATAHPIVSCRVLVRSSTHNTVWPRRLPEPGEDWSEYFFCRSTPFTGEGMVTMTSILTTTALVREVPFASGLPRHVDPDWMLRATRHDGVAVAFASPGEPLVIWNMEHDRPRITTHPDWRESRAWARGNRSLFTDRSYAAFLLHVAGSAASAHHAWRAFPSLLLEALRQGRPAPVDIASHVANFVLPAAFMRMIAGWYGRRAAKAGRAG